jgi:hypothetical protein
VLPTLLLQELAGKPMSNPEIGSSFDSFLEEAGIRDEVERIAQKRDRTGSQHETIKAARTS